MPVINDQCAGRLQELSLQHISNILWAYVSFLQMREPLTGAFLGELRARLRKATFNAQQLSNLLWSLCIAEVAPLPPPSCLALQAHNAHRAASESLVL